MQKFNCRKRLVPSRAGSLFLCQPIAPRPCNIASSTDIIRWAFQYSPNSPRIYDVPPPLRSSLFARLDVGLSQQGLDKARGKFSLIIMPQVRTCASTHRIRGTEGGKAVVASFGRLALLTSLSRERRRCSTCRIPCSARGCCWTCSGLGASSSSAPLSCKWSSPILQVSRSQLFCDADQGRC